MQRRTVQYFEGALELTDKGSEPRYKGEVVVTSNKGEADIEYDMIKCRLLKNGDGPGNG